MSELLPLSLADGESILVEVESVAETPVTRGFDPVRQLEESESKFEDVVKRLGPAVKAIVSDLRAAADWPDEVEVEFAVKLTTDANVVIAKAGGEANFRIALRWSQAKG